MQALGASGIESNDWASLHRCIQLCTLLQSYGFFFTWCAILAFAVSHSSRTLAKIISFHQSGPRMQPLSAAHVSQELAEIEGLRELLHEGEQVAAQALRQRRLYL